MEKDLLHWRQKFEACESLDTLKDKIFNLKQELAWAIIGEKERVGYFYDNVFKLQTVVELD